ncbi:MAG: DNA-binding response regulator [Micrococcales bacterium]|nr:DNA-binding response regulator [Micrococcales bacterium]NBT47188.1 DNA-binding response regulator [Actinomycetota bacterium]
MAKILRVALVGGHETIRQGRRDYLEANGEIQIVHNSDGFGIQAQDLLSLNFDVAILEQRLPATTAFALISASHALARVTSEELGRFLVSAYYSELSLRLSAIEAGAVDTVFVMDGLEVLKNRVEACADPQADFGIREIFNQIPKSKVSEAEFSSASVALDTLDVKEANIIRAFCELKTDAQIAQVAQVPKLKVRNTIRKVQNLLMLETRSQLLLKLSRFGALAL